MSESTPPGWYPDPEQPGMQQFWDGARWTGRRAPASRIDQTTDPGAQLLRTDTATDSPAAASSTHQRYKVVVVDFHNFKDALDGSSMERVMNEHAAQGWRVVAVTPGDVGRGFGGGRGAGVAITFERAG